MKSWESKSYGFVIFHFCGDRLHTVKDQWGGSSRGLVYCLWALRTLPQSRAPHRNSQGNLRSQASYRTAGSYQCNSETVHVCVHILFLWPCTRTSPTGIRCDGGSGAGWVQVQRGCTYALLQMAFVVICPASMAHMSVYIKAHTHTHSLPYIQKQKPTVIHASSLRWT